MTLTVGQSSLQSGEDYFTFQDLPPEIALYVLTFLKAQDLVHFSLVDRARHNLAQDRRLWQVLIQRDFPSYTPKNPWSTIKNTKAVYEMLHKNRQFPEFFIRVLGGHEKFAAYPRIDVQGRMGFTGKIDFLFAYPKPILNHQFHLHHPIGVGVTKDRNKDNVVPFAGLLVKHHTNNTYHAFSLTPLTIHLHLFEKERVEHVITAGHDSPPQLFGQSCCILNDTDAVALQQLLGGIHPQYTLAEAPQQ